MSGDPKIIVALDYPDSESALNLIDMLDPKLCRLKVGSILFTRYGPAFVKELQQKHFEIFLDLKFHDIPQTVAGACQAAAELGVWMVNVHASGGRDMLNAAHLALANYSDEQRPILIGVTVLTSLDNNDIRTIGFTHSAEELVERWVREVHDCGLNGVVCSPQEAKQLRMRMVNDFILVTPGIRLSKSHDDQKRVMSPKDAIKAGANYLVIGRPITQAKNPREILEAIHDEITE